MQKYNWFQKVVKSLVPGEFYLHILKESMGRAIAYILLFILTLSVLVGTYLGLQTKAGVDATLADYDAGIIPPVSFTDGLMDVAGDDTVIITHFDTYVVLDDDYSYDINDLLVHDNYLLFQQSSFSIVQGGVGPVKYEYEDLLMFDLSTEDVATVLGILGIVMIPSSIMSQFFLSSFNFFFNSIFLLLLGNILRAGASRQLKLSQVYHMVIYAMTFSVFWTHFTTMLPSAVPIWLDNFVYFAIPAIILLNVFIMIRKQEDNSNRS